MREELTLTDVATRDLLRLIAAARGLEVAGLLLGNAVGEQRILRAPNLQGEPGNVEIPRWWLDKMLSRRDHSGFRPIAFFHSHNSTLELSETDRGSLPSVPLPWVVLVARDGQLRWAVYGDRYK